MDKHTKGPWEAHGCTVYQRDDWEDGNNMGGKWIAAAYQDNDEMPTDEEAANSRLIAAAPDLLEALRLCITDQGALGYTRPKEYAQRRLDAITETARAAIAKATGEEGK